MTKYLFLLKGVGDFAPGAFENTAVESGSIRLGRSGGAYLPSGCYTSPPFFAGSFLRALPSWNAATPRGTAVEMQLRVATNRQWSRWFSFGKWSPFIERGSVSPPPDEFASVEAGVLSVAAQKAPADMLQLRIFLYSDDKAVSPMVWLLGAALEPLRREREEASYPQRLLQVPTYASLVRDPSIAGNIATATTLCMLMNRWGEDALPEEVARASYDFAAGDYGNIAFAAAIAGAYGYESYAQYGGIELLRQQIRRGVSVAAEVHYRLPSLSEETQADGQRLRNVLPVYEGAAANSNGHLVVVRGFCRKNGEEWISINDPVAASDSEVFREMPVSQFVEMYTGLCLYVHKGPKGAALSVPERHIGDLRITGGNLQLSFNGEALYPGQLTEGENAARLTICYTLPEGVVHASAAQKKFYYLLANTARRAPLDFMPLHGKKAAFYFIGPLGQTWAAEKTIENTALVDTPKEPKEEP